MILSRPSAVMRCPRSSNSRRVDTGESPISPAGLSGVPRIRWSFIPYGLALNASKNHGVPAKCLPYVRQKPTDMLLLCTSLECLVGSLRARYILAFQNVETNRLAHKNIENGTAMYFKSIAARFSVSDDIFAACACASKYKY